MSSEYKLYEHDEPALSDWEKELYNQVSRSLSWNLVEKLSDLQRISPSEDERDAAKIVEEYLEEYNIQYNRYDPKFWLSLPKTAKIQINGRKFQGSEENWQENRPSVKALAFSGSGTFSGQLEYVELPGTENAADALERTTLDSEKYELEGKIAVIDEMVASKQFFRSVEEAGAVGLISIHPHPKEPHITTAMPIWGAIPSPDQENMIPEMANITVSREIGDELLEIMDRDADIEIEISTEIENGWWESPVIVGKIPGEAKPKNKDFALLHGHLDSWYFGATDNATGIAGMIETGRILNQYREKLNRDLWLAFWPSHEGGRYGGSTWFADQFAIEMLENSVAHINFDSPGVKNATEFNMTYWHSEAAEVCRSAIKDVTGKNTRDKRPPRAADYSFYNIGVTGMMALSSGIPTEIKEQKGYYPVGGSGGNSEAWHHTTDTIDKADPDVLKRDIQVHLILLSRLLTKEFIPLDYRQTVKDHQDTVRNYNNNSDEIDLSPVLNELEKLEKIVNELYAQINSNEIEPEVANSTMKKLSRHLVRINFAERDIFEQDPATYRPPYPRLQKSTKLHEKTGNDFHFLKRNLEREVNHVRNELREAHREVSRAVNYSKGA